MILEDTAYRGFACPSAGLDRAFFDHVVVEHAKQTTEEFLRQNAGRLESAGAELVRFAQEWLFRDERSATVWNTAFGDVYSSLLAKRAGAAEEILARAALRLHECGHQGEWQVSFGQPARFRFDRWLVPESDALRVRATEREVTIRSRTAAGWRTATFARCERGWDSDRPASVAVLDERGVRCRILTAEHLGPAASTRLLSNAVFEHRSTDAQPDLLLRTGRGALDLIAELAEPYLAWVGRVVTDLLPLPVTNPRMQNSGSDNFSPGLLSVSNQPARCPLAEMLIHEGTHQYYFILGKLGPVDDGTDATLYFSPFRNMGRPIRFIVMAYHAFANVLLFYRMALARGMPADEPCLLPPREYVASLESQLETLERALRATTALTPLGRALWEPLSDELHR